jgi:WASH complex subunit 7
MVKGMKSNASRYGVDEDKLWQLEKLLFSLKGQLFDGRIFQNCIEQEFDVPGTAISVTTNAELKKEFFVDIKTLFVLQTTRIGDSSETNQRYKFIGLTALYVFYITLFKGISLSGSLQSIQ